MCWRWSWGMDAGSNENNHLSLTWHHFKDFSEVKIKVIWKIKILETEDVLTEVLTGHPRL